MSDPSILILVFESQQRRKKSIIMKRRAQKGIISGMPAFSTKTANIPKLTYFY